MLETLKSVLDMVQIMLNATAIVLLYRLIKRDDIKQ